MRKIIVFSMALLSSYLCLAGGPIYEHQDSPENQREFQNIYGDIKKIGVKSSTSGFTCIDSPTLCVDTVNHSVAITTETDTNLIVSSQLAVGGPLGQEYSPATTTFSITSTSSAVDLFRMTTYGNGPGGANNMHFVRSRGTLLSPSKVLNGDAFESVGSRGYDGSSWSDSSTAFQVLANEDWFPTAHGTKFRFETTPNGSFARAGTVDIISTGIVFLNGAGIVGITDGSDATSGNVGQVISSTVVNQPVGTSTQYFDICSILVPPGDWQISINFLYIPNTATVVSCGAGIGTVAGNDGTGLSSGDTFAAVPPPTATYNTSGSIAAFRAKPASQTFYYLKGNTQYSAGTPHVYARISAIRASR